MDFQKAFEEEIWCFIVYLLAKRVQNWIVDRSTVRNFMVIEISQKILILLILSKIWIRFVKGSPGLQKYLMSHSDFIGKEALQKIVNLKKLENLVKIPQKFENVLHI